MVKSIGTLDHHFFILAVFRQIRPKKVGKYVASQAAALVKGADLEAFIEDVFEDFREMDESRLAGLGIAQNG